MIMIISIFMNFNFMIIIRVNISFPNALKPTICSQMLWQYEIYYFLSVLKQIIRLKASIFSSSHNQKFSTSFVFQSLIIKEN